MATKKTGKAKAKTPKGGRGKVARRRRQPKQPKNPFTKRVADAQKRVDKLSEEARGKSAAAQASRTAATRAEQEAKTTGVALGSAERELKQLQAQEEDQGRLIEHAEHTPARLKNQPPSRYRI